MIDNAEQVESLLDKLEAALPLSARVTPELVAKLKEQDSLIEIPSVCRVTWLTYLGDEGGITCRLDFGREALAEAMKPVFSSITHLRFDPRMPLAREIVVYQKRRVKRLKRRP